MTTLTFHILDSHIQDMEIQNQSATTMEVRYTGEGSDNDDPEFLSRARKSKKQGEATFSERKLTIHLFGATAEGQSVQVNINGFEPFFYVKLPNNLREVQETFTDHLKLLIHKRNDWALKRQNAYTVAFERRKILMGYTGGREFTFAKLTVKSLQTWRALKSYFLDKENGFLFQLYKDAAPLEVFEANLDPMLRFFHLRDIKPCGWVSIDSETYDEESRTYEMDWDEISPAAGGTCAPFLHAYWDIECYSESGEFPLAKKGYERVAKLLLENARSAEEAADLILQSILYPENPPKGMDPIRLRNGVPNRDTLESHLHRPEFLTALGAGLSAKSSDEILGSLRTLQKKFPVSGDPIIQIGVVLERGAATFHEKHIFVLDMCAPIENVFVHSYKSERALLQAYAEHMVSWNPDILLGYNTFGFDERYLWTRCEELGLSSSASFQALSRLCDSGKQLVLDEKFLSSSALGDNTLYMLSMHGRLCVDLYQYIKRSFTLGSYKLDSVCEHFMSGSLKSVDCGSEFWHLNTKTTSDVIPGRYVVLLDETGDPVVDKLRVLDVVAGVRVVVEAPTGDDVAELVLASEMATKWAVVKDDVSPQELFRLHVGSQDDRAKIASYCIQDCILVRDLYKKLDVFNNAMAMANACSVPIPYIFTRGQGVKIESLIFKECYQRGQCVKVLPTTAFGSAAATNEDSYEGAIVLEPKPGIYYESPIGVADFASLYPSTIISENISFDTLVSVKDYDLAGRFKGFVLGSDADAPPDVQWTDISFDVWGTDPADKRKHPEKIKQGTRVCRYAQYDSGVKGTLPQIVQKLLATRKEKRKEAAKESDPFKKALLDAEQLAYKLTANSLYGQLGSATFKIRLQHLAASVTAYGRKQIMFAKAAIERFYGPGANDPRCSAEIVYGDTDSLFVNFNPVGADGKRLEGKEAIEATMHLTEEAGKFVTRVLKAPHDFEYDKVFYPFIIFSKKRYVGNKYEESADSYYQNSMGIATKRRDYAPIVKVIYGGAIRILLTERSVKAAYDFVQEKLLELVEGKISMNLLTMSKSLRAEYKTASPPAHKVLADRMRLRDEGTAPASGERVPFIYILPPTGQVASKLQGDRVEHPTYIKEKGLRPDFKFYIQHQLMNPLVQLFALVVEEIPGVVVPKGGWAEGDREMATTKAMFEQILAMCDRAAVRRFGAEFFGVAKPAVAKPAAAAAPKRTSERIAATKKAQQTSISTYFADKMLVKKLESAKKGP